MEGSVSATETVKTHTAKAVTVEGQGKAVSYAEETFLNASSAPVRSHLSCQPVHK